MKYIMLLVILCPFFINGMSSDQNEMFINHALVSATNNSKIDDMKALISKGADVNYSDPEMKFHTPLYAASFWGNPNVMKPLLEAGADPNKEVLLPGSTPVTPLSVVLNELGRASETYQSLGLSALRLLLEYGADINHPSVQKVLKNNPEADQLLKEAASLATPKTKL